MRPGDRGIRGREQLEELVGDAGEPNAKAAADVHAGLALLRPAHLAGEREVLPAQLNGPVKRGARFERLHDEAWLASIDDTAAQVAIAEGDIAGAIELAERAMATGSRTGNQRVHANALVTRGKALLAHGRTDDALASYEEAAAMVRATGPHALLREILGQWADVLATNGQHEKAYALTKEALSAG